MKRQTFLMGILTIIIVLILPVTVLASDGEGEAAPPPSPASSPTSELTPEPTQEPTPTPTPEPTPNAAYEAAGNIIDDIKSSFGGNSIHESSIFDWFISGRILDPVLKIFMPLGYIVMIIVWCVGLGKRAISLELYEAKTFIKEFSSLIVGIIIVGIMPEICKLTDAVATWATGQLGRASIQEILDIVDYPNITVWSLFNPSLALTNFLYSLPLLILVVIVFIKILVRRYMLAFYTAVSPLFGGFASSEGTSKYLKNFFVNYAVLSFSILIIHVAVSIYGMFIVTSDVVAASALGLIFAFVTIGIVMKAEKKFEKFFVG